MGAPNRTPLEVLTRTLKAERPRDCPHKEFWSRSRDVCRLGGLRGLYLWLDARDRLGLDDPKQLDRLFGQVERALRYIEKRRQEEEESCENTWERRLEALQQRAAAKHDWRSQYAHVPPPRVASQRQQRLHRKLDHLLAEVRAA